MEETSEQPRKIELNDGNFMPLLGLGTWKGKVTLHFVFFKYYVHALRIPDT